MVSPAKTVDYYYGIREESADRAVMFILDKNKKVIWQAPVIKTKSDSQYPDYDWDLKKYQFSSLTKKTVIRQEDKYAVNGKIIVNQTATQHCDIDIQENYENKPSRFVLNGQLVEVDKKYGVIQHTAFCSEGYAFIFLVSENNYGKFLSIIAFDKNSALPMYDFIPYKTKHGENLESFWLDYEKVADVSFVKSVELLPHKLNSKKYANDWEPAKLRVLTKDYEIIVRREDYF